MYPYFSLAGRAVLVAGGNRGIGQTITQGLLEAGVRVFICARDVEVCADTATHLSAHGDCQAILTSLSNETGARRLAQALDELSVWLDILVDSADTSWGVVLGSYLVSGWEKVMQLNATSVLSRIRQLLLLLRRSASAENLVRVISTGLVAGISAMNGRAYVYGPSEAALHQLSRILAKELVDEHINVNVIAPGRFPSCMTHHIVNDPQALKVDSASIPMGRWSHPGEMTALATSLVGAAGAYMTDNVIPIDSDFYL